MSTIATDAARMIDILPVDEQQFAYEFIKKLVRAWDPNFTKVTTEEAMRIKNAEESGFIPDDEIDWDSVGV
ncbi:MAG: hypothetical protein FWB96_11080 [Defluviitaleaceae bacterium]|nr:hypothetical protein [Defluviitaleaceae bacterium]MCL2263522.1 hypothetical protein [Defluviitaleaceae bacterium]